MNNYILEDFINDKVKFLPITYTKPISEITFGIRTIKQKWDYFLKENTSYKVENYLSEMYPVKSGENNIYINSILIPQIDIVEKIKNLERGETLIKGDKIIAYHTEIKEKIEVKENVFFINNIWDIFKYNDIAIEEDFKILTKDKKSQKISNTNKIIGNEENIFLEEGVKIECSILSVGEGFMYFSKNSEVMEGSMIKGNFSLGEGATIKMGAKIYGATTVGKCSKVGGEVNNSVIFPYSNKGHDGFLGNSVIGEWCNLGADTNTSNLKNNYSKVSLWDYDKKAFENTSEQFLGLIMGDHSKSGINTMFNTGTVVGCFSNIYGSNFPPKYIPCFSWGNDNFKTHKYDKALETSENMMKRRGINIIKEQEKIYKYLFDKKVK